HEVGLVGLAAIETVEHRLGFKRGARHRLVGEVQPRLLVDAETRVHIIAATMAAVGGNHCEAAFQRGREIADAPDCRTERAVEPTAALEQHAAVPVARQSYL